MKLFLDACTIIYLIESQQELGQKTRAILSETSKNDAKLIVSRLSLLECRVMPLKTKDDELLACYDNFFKMPTLKIIDLTEEVINLATDLRANYPSSLRTPDALQLACALQVKADKFLTGDKKLKSIQEIEMLIIS